MFSAIGQLYSRNQSRLAAVPELATVFLASTGIVAFARRRIKIERIA
jgi:hypothetical protein